MNVFIVDDSAWIREFIQTALTTLGDILVVGDAGTLAAASEGIDRTVPDVVILDHHLTDGSGLYLLVEIKHQFPKMVVIMHAGFTSPSTRAQCLFAGADYFFYKGQDTMVMLDTLSQLARSRTPLMVPLTK